MWPHLVISCYLCKVWDCVLSTEGPMNSTRLIQAVRAWSFISMWPHLVIPFGTLPGITESCQRFSSHFLNQNQFILAVTTLDADFWFSANRDPSTLLKNFKAEMLTLNKTSTPVTPVQQMAARLSPNQWCNMFQGDWYEMSQRAEHYLFGQKQTHLHKIQSKDSAHISKASVCYQH